MADGAWHTDDSYSDAGASVVSRAEALAADAVLWRLAGSMRPRQAALRPGQLLVGLLAPLTDPTSLAGFGGGHEGNGAQHG